MPKLACATLINDLMQKMNICARNSINGRILKVSIVVEPMECRTGFYVTFAEGINFKGATE